MKGETWARGLLVNPVRIPSSVSSVVVFDGDFGDFAYRTIAIDADANARFPRARGGELGLDEGLAIARAVRTAPLGAAVISIVDVPGQAFGRREESAGISLSLAAAVDAYISERRRGRPMFTLIVGKAISGAFLTHGMQGGWIGALDSPEIEVHVMSAASVARVTRSSDDEVARIATVVPATARDIGTFATFGAVDELFTVANPGAPTSDDFERVRRSIVSARANHLGVRNPVDRLLSSEAYATRALARDVRKRFDAAW